MSWETEFGVPDNWSENKAPEPQSGVYMSCYVCGISVSQLPPEGYFRHTRMKPPEANQPVVQYVITYCNDCQRLIRDLK